MNPLYCEVLWYWPDQYDSPHDVDCYDLVPVSVLPGQMDRMDGGEPLVWVRSLVPRPRNYVDDSCHWRIRGTLFRARKERLFRHRDEALRAQQESLSRPHFMWIGASG